MADKMKEYNRGRDQGLDMAWRLLRDAGNKEGAELIANEIQARGKSPIRLAVTQKEIAEAMAPMKWCMYETFMCMALMVLHDEFLPPLPPPHCYLLKNPTMIRSLGDLSVFLKAK